MGKRRNCSLRAISPFSTVFSKDLYCRYVKTRACLGKAYTKETLPHKRFIKFILSNSWKKLRGWIIPWHAENLKIAKFRPMLACADRAGDKDQTWFFANALSLPPFHRARLTQKVIITQKYIPFGHVSQLFIFFHVQINHYVIQLSTMTNFFSRLLFFFLFDWSIIYVATSCLCEWRLERGC